LSSESRRFRRINKLRVSNARQEAGSNNPLAGRKETRCSTSFSRDAGEVEGAEGEAARAGVE